MQDVFTRVDKAMDNFFQRVKNREKAGYPRFKSADRYDSFTYTQSGFETIRGKLNLSKIGRVKIKLHARPLKRVIQHEVENRIARAILDGSIHEGSRVEINMHDGKLVLTPVAAEAMGGQ